MKQENMMDEVPKESFEENPKDSLILQQIKRLELDYLYVIQKLSVNSEMLKEYEEKQPNFNNIEEIKEKRSEIRKIKRNFQENEIKLEKLLFSLDSLVGASENIRPLKKSLVSKIQKEISATERIVNGKINSLEKQIEETLNNFVPKEEPITVNQEEQNEPESMEESMELSEEIQNEKELPEEVKEDDIEKVEEEVSMEAKEETQNIPQKQNFGEDSQNTFPFPSKEEWSSLQFEPKFSFKKFEDKYVIFSQIENLDKEMLSVTTNKGKLVIEGLKYPTKEEQNILLKKLVLSLPKPSILKKLERKQIVSAILKLASQYNFGSFKVAYQLPSNFDQSEDVTATYENDLLKIEIPLQKAKRSSPNNFRDRRFNDPFWGFF